MFACCTAATSVSDELDAGPATVSVQASQLDALPVPVAVLTASEPDLAPQADAEPKQIESRDPTPAKAAQAAPADAPAPTAAPAAPVAAEEAAPTDAPLAAPADVAEVPTTTAAATTELRRPDLAGKWECRNVENLEEFLTVMGVGFMARKAAMTLMKSFVLKAEFQVEGDGERFKLANTTPKGVNSLEFAADGKEFNGKFGPEQTPGKGLCAWDGDTLAITVKQPGMVTETRRTLTEGKMVERTKAIKGGKEATVIRTWERV